MIIGSSGTGKSTLLKIILKYYEVKRNNIFLNDIEGKVLLKISQLGKVQEIFSSKYGWTLFILIPATYIIIDDIIKIIRIYKIRKQIESVPEEPEVEAIRNKEDNDKCLQILDYAKRNNINILPIKFGKSLSKYTIDKENTANRTT